MKKNIILVFLLFQLKTVLPMENLKNNQTNFLGNFPGFIKRNTKFILGILALSRKTSCHITPQQHQLTPLHYAYIPTKLIVLNEDYHQLTHKIPYPWENDCVVNIFDKETLIEEEEEEEEEDTIKTIKLLNSKHTIPFLCTIASLIKIAINFKIKINNDEIIRADLDTENQIYKKSDFLYSEHYKLPDNTETKKLREHINTKIAIIMNYQCEKNHTYEKVEATKNLLNALVIFYNALRDKKRKRTSKALTIYEDLLENYIEKKATTIKKYKHLKNLDVSNAKFDTYDLLALNLYTKSSIRQNGEDKPLRAEEWKNIEALNILKTFYE